MCGGVRFMHHDKEYRYYFPNPASVLPVKAKDHGISLLLPWGRREKQKGGLPLGGWARLESVYSGRWDRYSPRPVKLAISEFMEKDIEGKSHWFEVTPGKWIQGLVARMGNEQRIYVVTIEPEFADAVHDRWPRILSG